MKFDRTDWLLVGTAALTLVVAMTMAFATPKQSTIPVLYHCTIDASQRKSGLPRSCIIPATCEANARRIAEERCHWHGKNFYCVPMTKNYPDVIQMEITP